MTDWTKFPERIWLGRERTETGYDGDDYIEYEGWPQGVQYERADLSATAEHRAMKVLGASERDLYNAREMLDQSRTMLNEMLSALHYAHDYMPEGCDVWHGQYFDMAERAQALLDKLSKP